MAGRQLHRLSALRVAKEVTPGHYADGGGLYMQIADSGARSWVFRFKLNGRTREMGLGPLSRVSLGEARKLAAGYRDMVRDLIDPILARREQQRRQLLDISPDANVTFREATEAFISAHEAQWRNRKHVQQWGNTLKSAARVLHLLILTATRTNEVRFARPEEFDLSRFARRGGLGSRHRIADSGGLPASRSTRAAAPDDGRLGTVLR